MRAVVLAEPVSEAYRAQWQDVGQDPEPWELDTDSYPLDAVRDYLRPGDRIADLGCGPGRLLKWLAWRGYSCVGLDREAAGLSSLQRYPVVQADLRRLPFQPASFDTVIAFSVLDHIPDAAARADILRQLESAVRPGGLALVVVGHQGSWSDWWEQGVVMNRYMRRLFGRPAVNRHVAGVVFRPGDLERELRAATSWRVLDRRFIGARMALHTYVPWLRERALTRREQRNPRLLYVLQRPAETA